mmetsp:Transcript_48139/g.35329  ORF Transcript_48139/g.35329 Transcript_48139/m.35329 type:complete len:81 (+) Transcript_48139:279-521(+)
MDHQNIVELYNYTETPDSYVMFMEFCDRGSYFSDKILERHTPIKNNEKLKSYTEDLLEGLKFVHLNGVVHNDVKLENILL